MSEAAELGSFLRALHIPGPANAPRNQYRGVPLATRATSVEVRLRRLVPGDLGVSVKRVWEIWERTEALQIDAPDVWIHGDIHARNVIVADGRLAAIVDWGDMCVGDPATDLAAAWMLFPCKDHGKLHDEYGPISEKTWERARGWAVFFGVVLLDSGTGHDEAWADLGRRILERACA